MNYYCRLCDKTIKHSSIYKQNESKNHFTLENAIISRYKFLNPNFDKVDEIMKKYVNFYNKRYDEFVVHCLLKLLTNTYNIKYIRMTPRYYMYYILFTR